MADIFASQGAGLTSPAGRFAAVTPSDGVDLAQVSRALFVGVAGDLAVIGAGGDTVTFAHAPVGYHPIRVARVLATGTTATNIVALW